jgi:hypothetical protein
MSATLIMFSPKCAHCNEELPKRANFCVSCGKPFHMNDESSRPPAEIRPIRPIEKSAKLPAPPKTSSLSPLSESEQSQDKAADSWGDEEADQSAASLDRSAISMDQSAVSQDMNNTSMDMSNTSMDLDGGLLAPTEKSKRPWIYASAAAAFIFLLFAWPRSEKKPEPLVAPQEDETAIIEDVVPTPSVVAPTSVAVEASPAITPEAPKAKTPEAKASIVKNQSPTPPKTEVKAEAPKAEPKGPGVLGALQAQESNPTPEVKPEVKPEPKPEVKPETKPDDSNNAANEAAGFLDEN